MQPPGAGSSADGGSISFVPAAGEALTTPYAGRTIANRVDVLDRVDAWSTSGVERVYAVLGNLSSHQPLDTLLWAPARPRCEFVLRPARATSLNPIEPWWKTLRSLCRRGGASRVGKSSAQRSPQRRTRTPTDTPSSGGTQAAARRALRPHHRLTPVA